MTVRKKPRFKRYKNVAFLKELGDRCRRLRTQKGYSIDRLSKESRQLSTSVIHRLETGDAPVSISVLARYAAALSVPLRTLVDVETAEDDGIEPAAPLPNGGPEVARAAFRTLLPLYSMRAAAGYFGHGESVEPLGWVDASTLGRRLDPKMFVVQASGESMLPKIQDGDRVVFRFNPAGTRQGKIVLVQYRGAADPDTGGSYTIKKYGSIKAVGQTAGAGSESWRHAEIRLSPLNKRFDPIILRPRGPGDVRVIGEFVAVLAG